MKHCRRYILPKSSLIRSKITNVSRIESICSNGFYGDNLTFSDWTSSNHSNNSRDYKEYSFSGYEGDVLNFDYNVDSESYDHYRALITYNGNTTTLKDISGSNMSGSVTYGLPGNGDYILVMEYTKDHSVNSGRDNAHVYNIELCRSSLGAISREIASYNEMRGMQNDESVYVEAYMEVDSVVYWEEVVVDSAATAEY